MEATERDADFDTLAVARDLEASGIGKEPAEAVAKAIRQGRAGLATKADLEALRAALRADVAALETHLTVRMIAVGGLIVAAVKLL